MSHKSKQTKMTFKQRFNRLVEQQITEIRKNPHKFALGCAFGLAVNFIPTVGLGFLLALLLATIFRANKVSAPAISLLTGFLVPVKYALNLLVGSLIQAHESENLLAFITGQYALIFKIGNLQEKFFSFLDFFGSTFMVGAIVNAALFGTGTYFLVKFITMKKIKNS
jgi:uncharacterized protein (DUF2062 family)